MKHISPPVFYYHSVAPAPFADWIQKFLTIRLAIFEDQLAWLKAHRYRSIFLDEWSDIRQRRQTGTGREVCLTFDDGLLDNWVYAFPVAKKYGMRFTLFVSPECIDARGGVRPTLEDVWKGRCSPEDLEGLGYLTWDELKLMQESGVVDVQSHTMTHAKYVASPKLRCFYYGGFEGMHPILNAHPDLRASYMHDVAFARRLPLGTPLFEESSAVVVKKTYVNPAFKKEVNTISTRYDLADISLRQTFEGEARELYEHYRQSGRLLSSIESEAAYEERLKYEIVTSKSIIEQQLGKPVDFLCWPHGDNTAHTHTMAREAGYRATTSGKMESEADQPDRIPRMGADFSHPRPVSRLKFKYKVAAHYKKQPWRAVWLLNEHRHRLQR